MGKTNAEKNPSDIKRKAKMPAAATGARKKTTTPDKTEEDVHKYEVTRKPAPVPVFEELGKLPETYGEEVLYLIARDPHWLFCYWDIDWAKFPKKGMKDGEFRIYLKICTMDGVEESRIEINPSAKNWYVPVKLPATLYFAEIGWLDKKGVWKDVVRSLPAATPAASFSGEENANFATIPFHFTFQRLMDLVKGSIREGENLTQALSRLQGEERAANFKNIKLKELTNEQRNILVTMFGKDFLDKLNMSSADIEQLLKKRLEEKLSSESASGIMAQGGLTPGASSLFSALGAWGSEAGTLLSALGLSGSGLSSLFSGAGFSGAGAGSLFSGMGFTGSEAGSLSSGAGFWGPEVSSLFSGLGLWGSGASSLFSGVGASWSAQPFSSKGGRQFFMHVNAEVIFYGGTDPDAKVWIDGKQIALNPDGTFRYHFRFPDGDYQVPIVAQSPDKVEERSATLGFVRTTVRKGDVGHTGQPKQLKKPIGKRK